MQSQNETVDLFASAQLGYEADLFLSSNLGRHLVQRAIDEVADATSRLKRVDPEDAKSIRELQAQIRLAESIPRWLNEAVVMGRQAEDLLDERET